jgi:dCMP deaminase
MEAYIYGDMRLIMKQGEQPEICGAIHAERSIFTQAVKHGIPLEGKSIYTTTFPCLQCAQMIVEVGFKKVFFREGYSNQHAAELLKKAGIEIIQVK